MTNGTSNVARMFGSTYGDYGVQPDGATHDWREKAACVSLDDELFYKALTKSETADLRDTCAECPVLEQCRAAMREEESGVGEFGIWGFRAGQTQEERRAEVRAAAKDAGAATTKRDERDEQIRKLAAQGLIDREIGERLGVGQPTVCEARRRMGIKPVGDRRGGARGRSQIERERA